MIEITIDDEVVDTQSLNVRICFTTDMFDFKSAIHRSVFIDIKILLG